jgi:Ni/Co efflux regulator RcnB
MRNLLLAASCVALLAPCVGVAQGETEPRERPAPSESRPPPPPRPSGPVRPPPAGPGQFHPPSVAPSLSGPYRPGPMRPGGPYRPGAPGPVGVGPNHPGVGVPASPVAPEPRYGVLRTAPGATGGGYHRVRPVDRRIWSGNQKHWNWNGRRYHLGRYNYPDGYGYRRWRIGLILPVIFLQENYIFNDYASLGFDDPPPGYEWVRYGPDLLLVDLDTGEVVDVEYGVFD